MRRGGGQIGCLIVAALLLTGCSRTAPPSKLTSYVDPFIGTGGHGHTFPGATLPFGMVQLSPDTRLEGWDGCSGYHHTDTVVYGFSHTHLSGTGIGDYCDILFMPTVGDVRLTNGYPDRPNEGYASRFSKSTETASPGFYAVHLDDYDIDVALTCTERAGFHRYDFPAGVEANVIVDLAHRDPVIDSGLSVLAPNRIEGYRVSSSWAQEQHVYFAAEFSEPIASYGVALGDSIVEGARHLTGTDVKAFFRFAVPAGEPVLVKVGISAVDIEGARQNLDAEIPQWDFDGVRDRADAAWENALSKIVIDHRSSDDKKTIFYTALYHTMIAPNIFSDVDGRYRGTDLEIHESRGHDVYTVFSLWDTFRAAHPLYTIIERDRTADFIKTFLLQYEHGGRLPMWELAGNYTQTMIGYHSIPVIVDAYAKGIRNFDMVLATEAMRATGEGDERGLDAYKRKGFIASADNAESVSKTLEYAYDDWCIAQAIDAAPRRARTFDTFAARAQSYKNLYDPSTGFMRARTSSGWFAPFDPAEVNFNYTEANAWQYSFFVPHDVAGLIDLMGGRERFERRLDALFESTSDVTGRDQADITGLIGQYAHGNEPSHHMAYLYNYIGAPWKTQRRVRQIMDDLYDATADGLAGNEDCGQMSAWYVLSAMGFYPVTPGVAEYTIGTPIFERATIRLDNGNAFVVSASGVSEQNIYIQSARLNGAPYTRSFLEHDTIMRGGELAFRMGPEPNPEWATAREDWPVAAITDRHITPVPYFDAPSRTFTDSLVVEVGVVCDDCRIVIDGVATDSGLRFSQSYDRPIVLRQSTTLTATAISDSRGESRPAVGEYIKIPGGRHITLGSRYAGQYAAGGDHALIDYQRGTSDFRTGSWQGYQQVDLDAVVDLGQTGKIRRVSAGFLQDIRSWIWFPTDVEFAISLDGSSWHVVQKVSNDFADDEYGAFLKEFSVDVAADARYVRVRATNYGECPEWHLGAGGKTWIFVDEIVIE